MRRSYSILAALSAFFMIIGILCVIAGIGLFAYVVYTGMQVSDSEVTAVLLNGAVFLVAGILSGLLLLALGQLLRLLIDIAVSAHQTEIYTRTTAKLLQRSLNRPAAARVAPQSSMPRSSLDLDNDFSFLG